MIDYYLADFFTATTRKKIYSFAGLLGILLTAAVPTLTTLFGEFTWWTAAFTIVTAVASGLGYLARANTNSDDTEEFGSDWIESDDD